MGNPTGFIEFVRKGPNRRSVKARLKDYREFYQRWPEEQSKQQGGRCMNCAVPFCHRGCPLGNLIPEWNDLIYRGHWEAALVSLHSTNNFPEFTGRICPAPCEASCVLSINQDPVTIEHIEKEIVDRGFELGWIKPIPPSVRTGKSVAVVGSGPAGLAAAQQLNWAGHSVTVFERDESIGGLLSLGIPDFKLDKNVVTRRVDILAREGVVFRPNTNVGVDVTKSDLLSNFDAVCLCGGSTHARTLSVPGSDLDGIHLAMEYLTQQNRIIAGQPVSNAERITAEGKNVVILGGGDTGSDCLGTAHRQGAKSTSQFEILAKPPEQRDSNNPWPQWPIILRSSHAHEEGGLRDYNISTKGFSGVNGQVSTLHAVRVQPVSTPEGRPTLEEIPGSNFDLEVDLVLLAMGFLHPEHTGIIGDLGIELDERGNVKTNANKMTSLPGVFSAGDMTRGQSLVVWAIAEGRQAAYGIDEFLMGTSNLPQVDLSA